MQGLKNKAILFLKWLEKYIKTDMIYLAQGGFWAIVSQVTLSIATLLLTIAFAKYLSKDTYGQYKYILSVANIFKILILSGIGMATLQSVTRGYEGTLRYAFWQNIKWSALFFLGSGLGAIYYFFHGNSTLGISLLIIGCISPFWTSTNLYSAYLTAKKDFRRNALYFDIMGNLFPYACLFLTMVLTNNVVWLIFVYFASNTLIGLVLYVRILKIYKPNDKIDPEMLHYSKHLSVLGIIGILSENIDQIMVFHFIGPAQLATYTFAVGIPDQIKGPVQNLGNLMFPKFVQRENKDIRSGMNNKILLLFISSIFIIIVYWLAAPYLYEWFFPKYVGSIFYSKIYALSLLWIISVPANTYLSAKKKIKEQYASVTYGFIAQVALMSLGIIYWGLLGLIIARVIIRLMITFIALVLYNKASKEVLVL
jgi:O-antigen/teichoic acid export membrane protein